MVCACLQTVIALAYFKQNPISSTQLRSSHLSIGRSASLSALCATCRVIHCNSCQSSTMLSSAPRSIPALQHPAPTQQGVLPPSSPPPHTHSCPSRAAGRELESQEPVQPPAGTVRVLAAFTASLYRGGESCQWGGALQTTSCWKILPVPGLKHPVSDKEHIANRAQPRTTTLAPICPSAKQTGSEIPCFREGLKGCPQVQSFCLFLEVQLFGQANGPFNSFLPWQHPYLSTLLRVKDRPWSCGAQGIPTYLSAFSWS